MGSVFYRDARVFVGGYNLSGDHSAVSVALSAEMLDETAMGDSTRIHKGGLTVVDVEGSGHWNATAAHADDVLFGLAGVDDTIVTVFANGLTEGTETDMGFAMLGVLESYNIGGDVGGLLPFDYAIRGRGIQ